MIARVWSASATAGGADRYREHFTATVLPQLHGLDGFLGAELMEDGTGDRTHLLVVTRWETRAAIERFAGDEPGRAVVEPAAAAALIDFASTVRHYEVTVRAPGAG
ncbi:antibiotic biosynthesis monooxygenase [Pseudonocardia lacus]|uniref:antibiotic biosynthesis monooxygenase n=1 Tax=Pseudonocardia lacus TaxID=2835865 RepID=UPI001BDD794B|nr:antibiotic biosynthesis monooxygenase [Pseudonocardia lacus]